MPAASGSRAWSQKSATAGCGNDWVNRTCGQRERLPIAGFALKQNRFDGIYTGRLNSNDLVYAGKVHLGFDKTSAAELHTCLNPLIRKTQPYAKKIAHKAIWVEPKSDRRHAAAGSHLIIARDPCSHC